MLFENYSILNDQKIQEIAGKVGLDEPEFNKDELDPAINAHIRQDYEDGIELGVRGTPTVFINGKKLRDRSMSAMEAAIEEELQKQQKQSEKEEGK